MIGPSRAEALATFAYLVAAVLFTLVEIVLVGWPSVVYLWHQARHAAIGPALAAQMGVSFALAAFLAVATCREAMRRGVAALEKLGE